MKFKRNIANFLDNTTDWLISDYIYLTVDNTFSLFSVGMLFYGSMHCITPKECKYFSARIIFV